ncbi:MAG: DNA polymerase IV [Planctomycetes bacterium]|nr:DNA polymerase IV [Planctomycetota bacterium]
MLPDRAILHVDMDAFFASVEQLDDPSLRGKPVLVGHDGRRGVVMAASYEAREFGCHSAQPIAIAKRNCPHAVIVPGRGRRYHELSRRVFTILEDVTPVVEPLSIDEAFIDVTGSIALLGEAPEIAAMIKRRILGEIGLTASVGVAVNKFLAKLASDWEKPDGLTIITPECIGGRVAELPVRKMWGVGPVMETKLHRLGIRTFGDLQRLSAEEARQRLGETGVHFRRLARGEDGRLVTSDRGSRSIGNEQTFGTDLGMPEQVRQILLGQSEHIAQRVRHAGLRGRTVSVKIRYGDFETITRATTLDRPTDRTDLIVAAARRLFDRWAAQRFRPVRLIGVSVTNLQAAGAGQMDLFADADDARHRRLDAATDAIRERFGRRSISRGIRG